MTAVEPTPKAIDEQINLALETQDESRWPAMSFEAGVVAALRWVNGEEDEPPMED